MKEREGEDDKERERERVGKEQKKPIYLCTVSLSYCREFTRKKI